MPLKTIRHDPRQLSLFEAPRPVPDAPGAYQIATKVRETVTAMITTSGRDRADVAERMTALTGGRVTLAMLNAWTAESRVFHRFTLEFAPALERATGQTALTDLLALLAGAEVYYGPEALKARLGLLESERSVLSEAIRALRHKTRTA